MLLQIKRGQMYFNFKSACPNLFWSSPDLTKELRYTLYKISLHHPTPNTIKIYEASDVPLQRTIRKLYGLSPQKMPFKPIFDFQTFGGVFSGVKNISKNFGNKKNILLFSKILRKWTFFIENHTIFLSFYDLVNFKKSKNYLKSQNI